MMVTAVSAGVLFYVGLMFFHSQTALLVLQLFNAVFIGIVAGIGMLWFQDLMPRARRLGNDVVHQQHLYRAPSPAGVIQARWRKVLVMARCMQGLPRFQ